MTAIKLVEELYRFSYKDQNLCTIRNKDGRNISFLLVKDIKGERFIYLTPDQDIITTVKRAIYLLEEYGDAEVYIYDKDYWNYDIYTNPKMFVPIKKYSLMYNNHYTNNNNDETSFEEFVTLYTDIDRQGRSMHDM